MLIRFIIFGLIILVSIMFALMFIKDTGEERKKVEKRIKDNADRKLRESQEVWRQGAQRRK